MAEGKPTVEAMRAALLGRRRIVPAPGRSQSVALAEEWGELQE